MAGFSRSAKDWDFLKKLFVVVLFVEAAVCVISFFVVGLSWSSTGWMMLAFLFATLYFGASYFSKRPPVLFFWALGAVTVVLEGILVPVCLLTFSFSLEVTFVLACVLLLILLIIANVFASFGGGGGADAGGDVDVGVDI